MSDNRRLPGYRVTAPWGSGDKTGWNAAIRQENAEQIIQEHWKNTRTARQSIQQDQSLRRHLYCTQFLPTRSISSWILFIAACRSCSQPAISRRGIAPEYRWHDRHYAYQACAPLHEMNQIKAGGIKGILNIEASWGLSGLVANSARTVPRVDYAPAQYRLPIHRLRQMGQGRWELHETRQSLNPHFQNR